MPVRHLFLSAVVGCTLLSLQAAAGTFTLDVTADDSSIFYEYFSDAFAQISLRDPPPDDFRQRFHSIPDPSVSYGPVDIYPHDNDMHFGTLSYDDSELVGGTGTATITGLNLGLLTDPLDPTYLNWYRGYTNSTVVDDFIGTVSLVNGIVSSIDLSADVTIVFPTYLGSTLEGDFSGTFSISGNMFTVAVDDDPFLDPVFAPAGTDFRLEWAWTGTVNGVVSSIPGDLNGDGFVGQDDLNLILGEWGASVAVGSEADPSNDGFVGQDDLNIVLGAWGTGTPVITSSIAAVPEFSSFYLIPFTLGCLSLARRWRLQRVHA